MRPPGNTDAVRTIPKCDDTQRTTRAKVDLSVGEFDPTSATRGTTIPRNPPSTLDQAWRAVHGGTPARVVHFAQNQQARTISGNLDGHSIRLG
jgi:hypothetical protein